MDQSLYLCIVYAICAIAFVILAVVSKPLYAICAVLFAISSVVQGVRYFKKKQNCKSVLIMVQWMTVK